MPQEVFPTVQYFENSNVAYFWMLGEKDGSKLDFFLPGEFISRYNASNSIGFTTMLEIYKTKNANGLVSCLK